MMFGGFSSVLVCYLIEKGEWSGIETFSFKSWKIGRIVSQRIWKSMQKWKSTIFSYKTTPLRTLNFVLSVHWSQRGRLSKSKITRGSVFYPASTERGKKNHPAVIWYFNKQFEITAWIKEIEETDKANPLLFN